ncbi:TPA: class I SAM-dependent methyltransferase [Candidatus Poribacteria bacterium]|nr:class I SAM-dependent methyltransferase [Candidatus Poribacteria bacterium]
MQKLDITKLKEDIVFGDILRGFELKFHSTWGLFSPREIDAGSKLLIDYMEIKDSDICLDLGCGYGAIGLCMAKIANQGKVYMVDKDYVAVEYAKKNADINKLNNCEIFLSNAFSNISEEIKFDVIASNLPANVGKEMLSIILIDAKKYLKENGKLYVVTISGLREFIKRNFKEIFGNYDKIKQGREHAVYLAVKES